MRIRNKPELEKIMQENPLVVYKLGEKPEWPAIFNNNYPLHLEIGSGQGAFITQLAQNNPNINYIGLEKVKEVLIKPLRYLSENKLTNLRFIYGDARDLCHYFQPAQLERIYLNFSDPWPKRKHLKRRLTHVSFLQLYYQVLAAGGEIHLKTDSYDFFKFSLESLSQNHFLLKNISFDLHHSAFAEKNIMTEYERKWLAQGKGIFRLEAVKA